jgi:hypothetical protein
MPSKRGYKPVDRQSEALVRKNIIVRSVLVVLCAAILGIAIHLRILRNNVKDLDNLFSGTLIDDKGYYFPTTVDENRRSLTEAEADNDTLWSFDWTQDVDASAAVGVYYTAKGLALTNYYKAENGLPNRWTYDWQVDAKHGIELGERYKSIGEAINEHYRELYHPIHDKYSKKGNMKGWSLHDWKADRARGMAIAKTFKDIGDKIHRHYKKFQPTANMTELTDDLWKQYKEQGEAIASYYHEKGSSIGKFYKGAIGEVDGPTTGSTTDEIDPTAIQEAIKDKGLAIATYYRARYDPTFRPDTRTITKFPENATGQEWAPWGQDPSQDKAHGKAIGKYIRQHGQEIGQYYQTRGKELGLYYEDYYRSMFDPTYTSASAGAGLN